MSLMAVRIHDFWAKLWRPVRWNRGWLMGVGFVGFLRFFLMKNTKKTTRKELEHQKRRSSESSFPIGVDRLFFCQNPSVRDALQFIYACTRNFHVLVSLFRFACWRARKSSLLLYLQVVQLHDLWLRAVQLKISANLWPGMYPFNVTTNPPPPKWGRKLMGFMKPRRYIFKWWISHCEYCYVRLPVCNSPNIKIHHLLSSRDPFIIIYPHVGRTQLSFSALVFRPHPPCRATNVDQDSIKPHWEVRNGCCNQRILDEKSEPNSSSNVAVDVVVVAIPN